MKNEQPTHLDLFSGIGGFALAAQWAGFRTIGFCEIDKYCQKVLAKNFLADTNSGRLQRSSEESKSKSNADVAPLCRSASIHGNIFDLDGRDFYGVDLITGGFPCQPFSVAGKRRGAADDRHLWPEMLRVIKEARPTWTLGENVPGIIPMELENVLSDLESIGYATRPFVIPACAVDARHRRDRLWIVAGNVFDSKCDGSPTTEKRRSFVEAAGEKSTWAQHAFYAAGAGCSPITEGNVSNSGNTGLQGHGRIKGNDSQGWKEQSGYTRPNSYGRRGICEWLSEPDVGRVAHGVPSRVDRLKGLGNAIVPQVAYEIMREIRKLC